MFGVMEDLDNATTTKALVNKLHRELQEIRRKAAKWSAGEIKDKHEDKLDNKQAKYMLHPIYGN